MAGLAGFALVLAVLGAAIFSVSGFAAVVFRDLDVVAMLCCFQSHLVQNAHKLPKKKQRIRYFFEWDREITKK